MIGLISDTHHTVYIKRELLIQRSVYFKNMFSDVSSNKNDTVFSSNEVTLTSLVRYKKYVQGGELTDDILSEDFKSLCSRLGTIGFDADLHKLTVLMPLHRQFMQVLNRTRSVRWTLDILESETMWDVSGLQKHMYSFTNSDRCNMCRIIQAYQRGSPYDVIDNPYYTTAVTQLLQCLSINY